MIKRINGKKASCDRTKGFIKFWIDRKKGKQFLVLGEIAQGNIYQIISSNELPLGYIY